MATTTPNYGWNVPTSADYVAQGAVAIQTLGDEIDATVFGLPSGALALISTTTVGTGVSSVTVSGAFSATYDNYLILVADVVNNAQTDYLLNLNGSAGSTYSFSGNYQPYSSSNNLQGGTSRSHFTLSTSSSSGVNNITIDIKNPFLNKNTSYQSVYSNFGYTGRYSGMDSNAASSTAFTLFPTTNTLTGGTIRVYGYQN